MRALYWTLGLSWVAFLTFYLQGGRVGSPAYLAFGFLYMWIPGLVALSFARKEGVRLPLALRPNRYWLFAWLFPVALTLLSIPLSLPFGAWKGWEALRQTAPQEAAQAIPETLSALFPLVLILSALVAGATVNLLAALGEELLWRGYLWEKLKVRGFWPASLEIGFWWGLWHAPLILAGHNYPREPLLGVPMMILFTLALTPGLLWVREKAGSVLAAALFHGTLNAIAGLSLLLVERTHDLLIGVVGLPGLFLFGAPTPNEPPFPFQPLAQKAGIVKGMRFLVLSGLSGAGKTTARGYLEDLGYFMVDNLPPSLWEALLQELSRRGVERAGVVLDARALAFFGDLERVLDQLKPTVVYLEARPEVLLRRYNLTRRVHPLGAGNLMREIGEERRILGPLRARAHLVLDTSELSPRALKDALVLFLGEEAGFLLRLISFGFKWGPPQEADLVLDVRPLPNPHYDPTLKPKTGLDLEVQAYVFREEYEPYYRALLAVVGLAAEGAQKEGRAFYTVAVGCTGGRHRSVAVAERLAEELSSRFRVEVSHRDVDKEE